MKEETEEPKKNPKSYKKKSKYRILPLSIKKEAVEEYLRFDTPLAELGTKYGVYPGTIRGWVEQVERGKDRLISYTKHSKDFKFRVVREILSGSLTEQEAKIQYDVADISTIRAWVEKYSCQISLQKEEMKAGVQENITQFEKALQEAQLKILALETMIDVAEKELKIDIRKKSGTKQSN